MDEKLKLSIIFNIKSEINDNKQDPQLIAVNI